MMEELNIVEDEMVIVHGQYGKRENNVFVEVSEDNDVVTPYGLAGVGESITVISTATTTVDELTITPIRVDFS
jgi:hypothetical protein